MKKISLMLIIMFLVIFSVGCQENEKTEIRYEKETNVDKTKASDKTYTYEAVITEVDTENNRALLDISESPKGKMEQMWIGMSENTQIMNEKSEELTFEDLTVNKEIRVNLFGDTCKEMYPPICTAGDILVVTKTN